MNKSRVYVLFGITFVLILCLWFIQSDFFPYQNIILGEYYTASANNSPPNNLEGNINLTI